MKNKLPVKILAILLSCGLLTVGVGAALALQPADAAPSASAATKEPQPAGAVQKEETVYVLANADGTVRKIIVSDWLKNTLKQDVIADKNELSEVTNVKGDEGYSMNPDNMRLWDAKGQDIYYQGEIQKKLPVDISISYKLDGRSISAEELAGKSGKVTMTFTYTNNQKQPVTIDGKTEELYVPFVMLTGMILDNDHFQNVTVSNGKVISDGDKSVVIGFALPGMQENLNLPADRLELPSSVEITADATAFSLMTTMTIATNDVFNELDPDKLNDLNQLGDSLDELGAAAGKLVDGSSALYGGLSSLLAKSGDLIKGIDQLAAGAKELSAGAGKLQGGAADLQSGANELADGLQQLSKNSAALNEGAQTVFNTLLAAADSQLAAAGLQTPKLTIDNYAKVLDQILASLSEEAVRKTADAAALEKVTAAVNAQESAVRAQVQAVVRNRVLEAVLQTLHPPITVEQFAQAPKEVQAAVNAAVDQQMGTDAIKDQVDTAVRQQIQQLIADTMKSAEVQAQIEEAVQKAAAGRDSIQTLRKQLDSYQEFYTGLRTYTAGVDAAGAGSGQLKDGAADLAGGAADLAKGADQLLVGVLELQKGGAALIGGEKEQKAGAMQLSDGMKEFNKNAIKKLTEVYDGDVSVLVERVKAVIRISKSDQTCAGASDETDGSVKFIYKTDGIE